MHIRTVQDFLDTMAQFEIIEKKEGKEENNILTHIVGSDYNDIYRYLYDLKNEGKYKFILISVQALCSFFCFGNVDNP